MVTAIILLNVQRDKVNQVAEQLAGIAGISEVYSVGGRYDLFALVRVKSNEDLADLVTNQMVKLKGIKNTETLLAYRAYSRDDLEQIFSLGVERQAF